MSIKIFQSSTGNYFSMTISVATLLLEEWEDDTHTPETGEGDGFPRVRDVVSFVNPKSPVACPSTKGALESELTNLLVG